MAERSFGFLGLDFAKKQFQNVLSVAAKMVGDESDDTDTNHEVVSQCDIEFADGLTPETFTGFPRSQLDDSWIMVPSQELHAKRLLELSTNLRHIRFELCPKRMKDEQFWQVSTA
mmetsp:Transcript_65713/g.176074  ORF Transcript_65713/g.176074 Transcript_65713/m.176074 type:complete len:115 (+) Transcript_65713:74-418(+)